MGALGLSVVFKADAGLHLYLSTDGRIACNC
jgi:hypothetical protein